MKFTISGPPVGKGRPRTGQNRVYTPQRTREYESLVKLEYARQVGLQPLGKGVPVGVIIAAFYPIPKKTTKKNRALMLAQKLLPTKTPDWDNIGKIICDALNGLAWEDDAQVVDARVLKIFSEAPRVEVRIWEINKEDIT